MKEVFSKTNKKTSQTLKKKKREKKKILPQPECMLFHTLSRLFPDILRGLATFPLFCVSPMALFS